MSAPETLQELGLSQGESDIYLALLKLGTSTVAHIQEETKQNRTAIYDYLKKLILKGLISYVTKNNTRHYTAATPEKLLEFIKEKERKVTEILPELQELSNFHQQEVSVEVYPGKVGVRTIMNDIIRQKKDLLGFGIDDARFNSLMGSFMDQLFLKQKEQGLKERLLTYHGVEFVYEAENTTYRYIPKEYFNPTVTFVYGDVVSIMIWEPLLNIKITSKELATAYKKQFELIWSVADTENKK